MAGCGKELAVASPADVEILRCQEHFLWQAFGGHLPSWDGLLNVFKQPCLLHNIPLLHGSTHHSACGGLPGEAFVEAASYGGS